MAGLIEIPDHDSRPAAEVGGGEYRNSWGNEREEGAVSPANNRRSRGRPRSPDRRRRSSGGSRRSSGRSSRGRRSERSPGHEDGGHGRLQREAANCVDRELEAVVSEAMWQQLWKCEPGAPNRAWFHPLVAVLYNSGLRINC